MKLPCLGENSISKSDQYATGFKAAEDRVALLLFSNSFGDCVIKLLMLYKSLNPRALKIKTRTSCQCFRGQIRRVETCDWLQNFLLRKQKSYLTKKVTKIFLVLDNAPARPRQLEMMYQNIQVKSLPTNRTQPYFYPSTKNKFRTSSSIPLGFYGFWE